MACVSSLIDGLLTLLQAALSQLPMGDLNTLLRYICQYMPMGPCPGVVPPTGPPLSDGTSSDGVCLLLLPLHYLSKTIQPE